MEQQQRDFAWLYSPPSSTPQPPIEKRLADLPIDQLSWQDFEKLCHRLVRSEASVEYCRLYGTQGEAQEGIDILARLDNSLKYRVYQCKNVKDFGPAHIKDAVTEFVGGGWLTKTEMFVLCTRETLRSTVRAAEIERQAQELRNHGITLIPWDKEELSLRLKSQPEIVDDFFGRAWVRVYCGEDAASQLGERLDSDQLRNLRAGLRSLYDRIFNLHDRGVPLPDTLPLYERYIVPDVDSVELMEPMSQQNLQEGASNLSNATGIGNDEPRRSHEKVPRRYSRRLSIERWVLRAKHNLLFGEPGSGKSTFLRFLALDLLHDRPSFLEIAKSWGDHLPIWIPFAFWTRVIHSGPAADRSVKSIVTGCLRSWDADHLVPLIDAALKDDRLIILVDGLDEHTSTETAEIALNHLDLFLELHDVPVIATSRPYGFERLAMRREGWERAAIGGLTNSQQTALATIWFQAVAGKMNTTLNVDEKRRHVQGQVDTFFAELLRSRDLRDLASNPLLLCLLISLQTQNVRLPLRRFDAYAALTDHLISTHPQRRATSARSSRSDLRGSRCRESSRSSHTRHQATRPRSSRSDLPGRLRTRAMRSNWSAQRVSRMPSSRAVLRPGPSSAALLPLRCTPRTPSPLLKWKSSPTRL